MSVLYQVLIRLAALLALCVLALRGMRDRSYRDRFWERLGFTRLRFSQAPLWVHAVSVGEVQAATPLVQRLLSNAAGRPILITTATPTGAKRVRDVFGDQVQHAFLPYDTPGSVRRFLKRVQPHCLIIMETELWPNVLRACQKRQMPMLFASARISSRTAGRYRRLRSLFTQSLPSVWIGAQTADDADRFVALGALPEHVHVSGSIKFDIEVPVDVRRKGQQLRQQFAGRAVWVAGSTHPGEDEQVLAAHQQVLEHQADALLILAPRHPQRFVQAAHLVKAAHLSCVSHSSGEAVQVDTQVLLLDTLGELTAFYAAADVVFVGGSLVPVGGHNLLEPAALSMPIVSGPHTFNAPDVAAKLAEATALRYVYSAGELAEVVVELLKNSVERQRQGQAALQVLADSRGALQRLLQLLAQVAGVRC